MFDMANVVAVSGHSRKSEARELHFQRRPQAVIDATRDACDQKVPGATVALFAFSVFDGAISA